MSDDDKKQPTRRTRARPADTTPAEAPTSEPVDAGADAEAPAAEDIGGVMTTETALIDIDDVDPDEVAAALNRLRFGELVVHYPERDVTLVLDGASASKVMAVHAGFSNRLAMQDQLEPLTANMANMWASIDMDRALAMSWIPGLAPSSTRKMTIDPGVPVALQH